MTTDPNSFFLNLGLTIFSLFILFYILYISLEPIQLKYSQFNSFTVFFTSNEHIYSFTHIKLGHYIACANFELEKQTLKLCIENQKARNNKDCKDWLIDSTFNNILRAKNFVSLFSNITSRILTFYYNNQNSNNDTILNIRIKLN